MTTGTRVCATTRRRAGGFTLLEALTTIVVLMILLPVILQGFNLASKMALRTRQQADATALAQSAMDELVATGEWQNSAYSREQTVGNMQYTVDSSLSNWEEADNQQLTNLQQLDVTVRWTFENAPQQLVLSSVVYQPDATEQQATTDAQNNAANATGTTGGGTP